MPNRTTAARGAMAWSPSEPRGVIPECLARGETVSRRLVQVPEGLPHPDAVPFVTRRARWSVSSPAEVIADVPDDLPEASAGARAGADPLPDFGPKTTAQAVWHPYRSFVKFPSGRAPPTLGLTAPHSTQTVGQAMENPWPASSTRRLSSTPKPHDGPPRPWKPVQPKAPNATYATPLAKKRWAPPTTPWGTGERR